MKNALIIVCSVIALMACSPMPDVGKVTPDKAIGNWQVVTTQKDQSGGLCYAFSSPKESSGSFTGKRGAAYVMATRRASGKVEISVSSGYSYRSGSDVTLVTDDTTFKLKPKDNIAWAHNDTHDKLIAAAIKKADSIEVRGVTADGKTTADTYSAEGFADALARVKALCP